MVLQFLYSTPTTPAGAGWVEDLGTQAVRLGSIGGLSAEAELGAVATSQLLVDDPDATAGHDADAILGLKNFRIIEDEAPADHQVVWIGYTGDRAYRRGSGDSPSLIQEAARLIDLTLVDVNTFLTFRVFQPEDLDATSSFNRPAETDVARVTALLAVDFLSTTLFDHGLVETTGGVAMDAVDYTGQKPIDVLNDCAQQSGRNFFVYYDEVENDLSLFYHNNSDLVYLTDMRISNVRTDIEGDIEAPAGPTWPPLRDAELQRDPSRVIAGGLSTSPLAYENNLVTSYAFGYRDAVVDSPNVKTAAKASARINRYLDENNSEDDRITVTVHLPAANVNDWMQGQAGQVRFSHLPGYEDEFRYMRCIQRTVMQDEETPEFYHVRLELSPIAPQPMGAFDGWKNGAGSITFGAGESGAIPNLPRVTTPGNLLVALIAVHTGTGGPTTIVEPTFETPDTGVTDYPWTTAQWHQGVTTGANIDHAWPVSTGVTAVPSVAFGIVWRKVQLGEVTQTPLRVVKDNAARLVNVWLYEFPTQTDPTLSTYREYDNATTPWTDGGPSSTGTIVIGADLAGWVLGGFIIGCRDYGPTPALAPTNGQTIRAEGTLTHAGRDGVTYDNVNDLCLKSFGSSCAWHVPWCWIGQSGDGTALALSGFLHDTPQGSPGAYNNFYSKTSVIGAAIVIPGQHSPIPDIPYPANQTA